MTLSITKLLDAIGFCADEELAGTIEDKFIAVDFDFATILFLLFLHPLRHLFWSSLSSWNS